MTESFIEKQDKYPTSDTQQKKVYSMDASLSTLLENKKINFEFKYDDYLQQAEELFANEGFSDYIVLNNKSVRVSNVNPYTSKLTFSKTSINKKSYETILHELAHSITYFKNGYCLVDGHSELFVYNLFKLINKYFNISYKEMEYQAKKHKVKYLKTDIVLDKEITKNEFDKYIKDEKINGLYNTYKIETLNKLNICYCGYDIKNESFIAISKTNNNTYHYFERELFLYERNLYINEFEKLRKKELVGFKLFSPIVKSTKKGRICKTGQYFTFGLMDHQKAMNKDFSIQLFQNKYTAERELKETLDKAQKAGFKIQKLKDFNQYLSKASFFIESVNQK